MFITGTGVTEVGIEAAIKIGKRNSNENNEDSIPKPRPLLVKLRSSIEKFEILKRAKNLKDAQSERLKKIAPDMTKKERKKDKELREKLREKQDQGENYWYIRRGQLRRNFWQETIE